MNFSPIDPASAADYIVSRLCRTLRMDGREYSAIAETEHPLDDDEWFWTDDNCKIVEFLAHPVLRGHYSKQTGAIMDFIRSMCRGPFMLRRVARPRLLSVGKNGDEESFYHSMLHLRSDLSRGLVTAGIRFHDNRTADNVSFHGNNVEFTYRGIHYKVAPEPTIDQIERTIDGNRLLLRYSAELRCETASKELRVGRISYTYTIDARSMALNVEASLEVDRKSRISDVVLTISHDNLSHGVNNVRYNHGFAQTANGETIRFNAETPADHVIPASAISYYSIAQSEIAGFALGIHTAPREPSRLAEFAAQVREPGLLHSVQARYRFSGGCRGERLVVSEDKMLTGGGFYERAADYNRLLRDLVTNRSTRDVAVDFSISYDYGSELHAFAKWYALLSGDRGAAEAAADMRSLFDSYLAIYFELFVAGHLRNENTIFSRQLAFVVLSLVTMYRATSSASYRVRLCQLCDILLEFEKRFGDIADAPVSGFMMGLHSSRIVFVDCHSAALLALTEAAACINGAAIAEAIDRGLGSFCLGATRIEWITGPQKADVVGVEWVDDNGTRHQNHAFWNYHAGLMLRLFAALRRSANPAIRAVAARHRDRIALFEMIIDRQIRNSLAWHGDTVEIRCSTLSVETNSETQPWVALGLLERDGVPGPPH